MGLTQRRLEFLTQVVRMYEESQLPVHYQQVAERLGVSKWTAYEMMKELEKEGYLTRQYVVNSSEKFPGRSMVFFRPTSRSREGLFADKDWEKTPSLEWRLISERLLQICGELRNADSRKIIDQLHEEMSSIELPLVFNAYTITLLIAHLKNLGEKSFNHVKTMVLSIKRAEMSLAMFVGTVVGSLLKTASQLSFWGQLTDYIERFHAYMEDVGRRERHLLRSFMEKALEEAV